MNFSKMAREAKAGPLTLTKEQVDTALTTAAEVVNGAEKAGMTDLPMVVQLLELCAKLTTIEEGGTVELTQEQAYSYVILLMTEETVRKSKSKIDGLVADLKKELDKVGVPRE